MEYMYLLVLLLITAFIITLYLDKNVNIEKKQMKTLSKDDFIAGIRTKARDFRHFSSGKGVNINALRHKINKAVITIGKKNNKGGPLFEYERWLYENSYLVRRALSNHNNRKFNTLPHSNQKIRILELARYIVLNSEENLTEERVVDAIKMINNETSLYLNEIMALKSAISYAIIEQIYILSERIIYHNKMEKHASRKYLDTQALKSDIYCHYALRNHDINDAVCAQLLKMGVEIKSIDYNYSLSTLESTKMAKSLFKSLMHINNLFNEDTLINHLNVSKVLKKDYKYNDMSLETKKSYLKLIENISSRLRISELLTANKLMELARFNDIFFGDILSFHSNKLVFFIKTNKLIKLKAKNTSKKENFYISSLLIITIVLDVMIGLYFDSLVIALLSIIPIFFLVDKLINIILVSLVHHHHIPSMNYISIPNECNTLIVISQFITSKKQLSQAIHHLESVKESNHDKNIQASLLIDFKSSDNEIDKDDEEMIEMLRCFEGKENYNIFVRKRTKCGKKYSGYERKRGAIMALNKYLISGIQDDFYYIANKDAITPKYIIALDDDNVMRPDTAKDLINTIAHPSNAKYDLIAVRSKYNLYSIVSRFSTRYYYESGVEAYPNYSSLYFNMFAKDIFCGKGIYKLKEFYNKLEGIFPSNKILSHDILEGSILTTASTSVIYENAPKNFVSERERKTRWQRGDIELLPFISKKWRNDDNETYKSEISPFYKFIILKNVLSIINPLFVFIIGILAFIYTGIWLLFLFLFVTPLVIDIVVTLQKIKEKIRFLYIFKRLTNYFYLYGEALLLLPYEAFYGVKVLVTTIIKMLKKGNLLEWKTYYSSQNNSDFSKFSFLAAPVMPILLVIIVIMYFTNYNILPISAYALLTYFWMPVIYALGKEIKKKTLNEKEKDLLHKYAYKTYNYFKYMNNGKDLIADNLQLKPYKGISETTSPTNIGYGLLSEVCAYYLELNDLDNIVQNIEETINKIEKLEKWNGNLYNWYHTKNGEVAQKYVSSVDSGNFIATMIIVNEFLKEQNKIMLSERVEAIINQTEINRLYDEKNNLFYLGYNYNDDRFEGYYDLLASESRLLSLIHIAYGGSNIHYRELIRDYTPIKGNTLYSWSGTMFEYLMPNLFIQPPQYSLIEKSSKNSVAVQKKVKKNGVWGLSESGFYKFDENLRYQYRAFGVNALSLDIDIFSFVVSTYSSFLAVAYYPKAVIKNLKKLEQIGAYGEYGFYESIDFTSKKKFVSSYMTHHQGMITAALTNYLKDNILISLMTKNPKIEGVKILLSERVSELSFKRKQKENKIKAKEDLSRFSFAHTNLKDKLFSGGLSNGTVTGFYDSNGNNFFKYADVYINKFRDDYKTPYGGFFYLIEDKNVFSPTYYPLEIDKDNHSFTVNSDSVNYHNTKEKVILDIAVDENFNAEVKRLAVPSKRENIEVVYFEELAMSRFDQHCAHPVFCNLFIRTSIDKTKNIIIAHRKELKKEGDVYTAYVIRGLKDLIIDTNRFNFIGRNNSEKNPDFIFNYKPTDIKEGDVLEPCIGIRGTFAEKTKNGFICEIIKIVDSNLDNLLNLVELLPNNFYQYAVEKAGHFKIDKLTNSMIAPLIYKPFDKDTLKFVNDNNFEDKFKEINKMKKSILYKCTNMNELDNLYMVCESINKLKLFGIDVNLIIIFKESFALKTRAYFENLMKQHFIYDYELIDNSQEASYIYDFAFIRINDNLEINEFRYPEKRIYADKSYNYDIPQEELKINFTTGEGGFNNNSEFVIAKEESLQLPYSNVVAGKHGGFIVTENGGGFTFFDNSRENKVTRFENDPIKDEANEKIYVYLDDYYRLNQSFSKNSFLKHALGTTFFTSYFNDCKITTQMFIIDDGRVKVNEIRYSQSNINELIFKYSIDCSLGWRHNISHLFFEEKDNILAIKNLLNMQKVFISVINENKNCQISYSDENGIFNIDIKISNPSPNGKLFIVLSNNIENILQLSAEKIEYKKEESIAYFNNLNNIEINSGNDSFDILVNKFLLYQVVSSRLNAKSGYYQVGGATGFRDQLQDALALLHSNPARCREQILYHATHQYAEGDVMHWWHHEKFGIRTRISDDKLYLPYATACYIEATNDYDILKEELPYLCSQPLTTHEMNRFENPPYTDFKSSLKDHCIAAIKSALKFGEHNLLQMGAGDWNDGMDYFCEKGYGESVVLTMFAYETIMKFKEYCDDKQRLEMLNIAKKLQKSIETHTFEGNHYMRAYSDSGKWYGTLKSEELNIDLVAQSFAALSEIGSEERVKLALESAKSLVDYENGLIKLLYPPLNKQSYIGYISSYPEGVRENGGQYTHAAIWYIMALIKIDKIEEAFELFQMINPIEKNKNKLKAKKYKGEPYVLSGDVYSGETNAGRMGWSWYTGSAAWAYRLIVEEFYGLKIRGNELMIDPKLPKALRDSKVTYKYKNSVYTILYKNTGSKKLLFDDIEIAKSKRVPLYDNKNSEVICEY